MKRTLQAVGLAIFAAQALVVGQSSEVTRVLSQIRTALGGDAKIAAVKTIAVEGQTMRPAPDGSTAAQPFEMVFDLPANGIRFVKQDVVMSMGNGATISRRSGFAGNVAIDQTDLPPGMGDGVRVMRSGPGGPIDPATATPDQLAKRQAEQLQTNRREFARFALGMIGTTTAVYPVEFTYAGQADSGDGKADVLEIKAADGFTAKLYVDGKTHLPLMLAWMDKEPLRMMMNGGGTTTFVSGGGAGAVRTMSTGGGQSVDPAKAQEEMAARMKEAEASRKTVEYRLFYADYKAQDGGVKMPTRLQRMVDGLPADELVLEKIKVNGKIDESKFASGK